MRPETEQLLAELTADAQAFVRARATLATALQTRDVAGRRAARQVLDATGGIGVDRWEADLRLRAVATAADALRHARALRAAPTVQAAIAEQQQSYEDADRAVTGARAAVARMATALLAYGPTGAKAAGLNPSELRHLAEALPQAKGVSTRKGRPSA